MDDDFVDVFPSAGGVGDSPVKSTAGSERGSGITGGDTSRGRPLSLSIGIETGGAAAAVSPAVHPYSHSNWIVMPSPSPATSAAAAKESALRSAKMVSDVMEQQQQQQQQQQENKDVAIFCGGGGDNGDRSDTVLDGSPTPSPAPMRFGMAPALTIDPGGECVPTELEKKRQKLERYRFVCSEVEDAFIYVAGEDAAKQEGLVRNVGITHIINCAGPQCPNYLEYTGRFTFLRLNFYDHRTEDIAWFIYSAFDFIAAAKAKKGRILIHCVQGVSRSCTLAIAWLMLTTPMEYEEAYQRVRQGRPICAPNTGFICSLLEWEKRRRQPPAEPLMYRTAWHVPNFAHDLVLKLCMHEEDRKHLRPLLASLDSRGCYLIVVPAAPRPNNYTSRTTPERGEAARGQGAGAGTGGSLQDPYRSVSPSGMMDDMDEDEMENVCAAMMINGDRGSAHQANSSSSKNNSCNNDGATHALFATTMLTTATTTTAPTRRHQTATANNTIYPAGNRNPGSNPAVPPQPAARAHELPTTMSAAPNLSVFAPLPGSSAAAAAAAGEAARTVKTLEVGGVIAAAFREPATCARDTGKAKLGLGSATGGRSVEGFLGPAAKAVAAASTGVEVYVWRGAESNPQMLELARTGARWLRDYEGWGAGTNTVVVDEGREPLELLRHLEVPGDGEREPPIYGDLTTPSPPTTAARNGPGCLFHHTVPTAYASTAAGGGALSFTPRHANAPLPSPAEAPTLSPMGPTPSPGGGSVGFSPSPYEIGVSPAGDVRGGMGGVSPAGGRGMCGVSPAGGGDMCGVSPTGGGDMCTGDMLMPSISPAGSAAASPATPRMYAPGEGRGCGYSSGDWGGGGGGSGGGGTTYAVGGLRMPRCSVGSATEAEVNEEDEYLLMGVRSAGAAEQPSAAAIAHVRDEAAASNGGEGVGNGGEGGGATVGVAAALAPAPAPQRREKQRAPRLFELAGDLGGGPGVGGELHWSELSIFDDQDLHPQCCFLLVPPVGKNFLWIGEEFAAAHTQDTDSLRQVHSLATEAAARDDAQGILGTNDVGRALVVSGDGHEPEEWWDAFESGYS